jgi:hypothetical protein
MLLHKTHGCACGHLASRDIRIDGCSSVGLLANIEPDRFLITGKRYKISCGIELRPFAGCAKLSCGVALAYREVRDITPLLGLERLPFAGADAGRPFDRLDRREALQQLGYERAKVTCRKWSFPGYKGFAKLLKRDTFGL